MMTETALAHLYITCAMGSCNSCNEVSCAAANCITASCTTDTCTIGHLYNRQLYNGHMCNGSVVQLDICTMGCWKSESCTLVARAPWSLVLWYIFVKVYIQMAACVWLYKCPFFGCPVVQLSVRQRSVVQLSNTNDRCTSTLRPSETGVHNLHDLKKMQFIENCVILLGNYLTKVNILYHFQWKAYFYEAHEVYSRWKKLYTSPSNITQFSINCIFKKMKINLVSSNYLCQVIPYCTFIISETTCSVTSMFWNRHRLSCRLHRACTESKK